MLEAWTSYGFGIEIVRRAYEITISSTNTPSIPYTNAILTRWSSEGWRTAEEIDAHLAEEAAQKNAPTLGNSFETDDFFEAALQRSLKVVSESDKKRGE